MTAGKAAAWAELNSRQREYLAVFYAADQDAAAEQRRAAAQGEYGPPAAEWRWQEYGWVSNPLAGPGLLQQQLDARGIRDQGAGSTLAALQARGLIDTRARHPDTVAPPGAYIVDVRMTRAGRATCRAGGCDSTRPGTPRTGELSEALWSMLIDVRAAGPDGLARRSVGGA